MVSARILGYLPVSGTQTSLHIRAQQFKQWLPNKLNLLNSKRNKLEKHLLKQSKFVVKGFF